MTAARYFEDLQAGQQFQSETYLVTEDQIYQFAAEFDPQPFHLDKPAAEESMFRGLAASGWHTAGIAMRLFVKTMNFSGGVIGLGVEQIKWPKPVRPGDTLKLNTEVLELRSSKSKPSFGILRFRTETLNQHGQLVQVVIATAMVRRRAIP